jgi:hypothetical protein
VCAFAEQEPTTWQVLFGYDAPGEGEPARMRRQVHGELVDAVTVLLAADAHAAGIDPGALRATAMVEMLIAALRGGVEWRSRSPGVDRELLVDAAMELLWRGLGRTRG